MQRGTRSQPSAPLVAQLSPPPAHAAAAGAAVFDARNTSIRDYFQSTEASYASSPADPRRAAGARSSRIVAAEAPVTKSSPASVAAQDNDAPAVSLSFDSEPAMPRRSRRRGAQEAVGATVPSPTARRKRKSPPCPADAKPAARLKTDPTSSPQDTTCCICMTETKAQDVAKIDGCKHLFCFECIEKWADHENKCPLCKERFHKIERLVKPKRGKGKSPTKSSKKVKNRDQQSETQIALGSLFEDLLSARAGFPQHHFARLLFSSIGAGSSGFSISAMPTSVRRNELSDPSRRARPIRTASATIRSSRQAVPSGPIDLSPLMSSSDEEDEDYEDEGFGSFVTQLRHGGVGHSRVFEYFTTVTTTPVPPARSYANNSSDRSAGRSANNALFIDDSDSDEVEVLEMAD